MNGCLLTCEGADCSGKSTNVPYLVELLRTAGYDVVQSREPGGTEIGEEIRNIILKKREGNNLTSLTELLLCGAFRSQHIEELIVPALNKNKIVILDRFSDSTHAYQGWGRGLIYEVEQLENIVEAGLQPDYTLFFDIKHEESKRRMALREGAQDRLDHEQDDFKLKVHAGYNHRYKTNPDRMYRIDANLELTEVQIQIREWVEEVFIPENPLK